MNNRIELIIERMNLSSSQFADEIGVARAVVSHLITGRNKPSLDVVRKILLRFPQINPDWLLTGKGEFFRGEVEKAVAEDYIKKTPVEGKKLQPTLFPEEVHRTTNLNESKTHEPEVQLKQLDQPDQKNKSLPDSDVPSAKQINLQSIVKKEVQTIIMIYSDNTFELLKPSTEGKK